MPKMVIIADDLTGATDSAAAYVEYGMETIVLLSPSEGGEFAPESAGVIAIDANTRCLTACEAADITAKLVQRYSNLSRFADQALLFKKVDSTLRGHLAAELAAALKARRTHVSGAQRVVAVWAPAFPAQGRTTVQGRQMLHGMPLEETDPGPGERVRPRSEVAQILSEAGLSCGLVDIATVRSGASSLSTSMVRLASTVDVIVCDAITDEDLQAIASASLTLGSQTVWAGSGGLARHMPSADGSVRRTGSRDPLGDLRPGTGPTLFVVGSLVGASREQARTLAAAADVETVDVKLSTSLNEPSSGWRDYARTAMESLRRGRDVLLTLHFPEQATAEESKILMASFARIVQPCADHVGALVATGGETARAVLDAWDVRRLRLLGEVEPGLPYSITERWTRDILVLTKAGGFGTPETFLRCREFLRTTHRNRCTIAQHDAVVDNQKG